MKKIMIFFLAAASLTACNDTAKTAGRTDSTSMDNTAKSTVDLPFTALYTTNWSDNVSDVDLKTVMNTYKDWRDGNMSGLESALADSVDVDMSSGEHLKLSKADLIKMWRTYRDSLSSVKIDMATWHKMHATDSSDSYIVTWYDETDTYKTGKVDSAAYHDINQVKDGKIIWYAQYKRPKKPMK